MDVRILDQSQFFAEFVDSEKIADLEAVLNRIMNLFFLTDYGVCLDRANRDTLGFLVKAYESWEFWDVHGSKLFCGLSDLLKHIHPTRPISYLLV